MWIDILCTSSDGKFVGRVGIYWNEPVRGTGEDGDEYMSQCSLFHTYVSLN